MHGAVGSKCPPPPPPPPPAAGKGSAAGGCSGIVSPGGACGSTAGCGTDGSINSMMGMNPIMMGMMGMGGMGMNPMMMMNNPMMRMGAAMMAANMQAMMGCMGNAGASTGGDGSAQAIAPMHPMEAQASLIDPRVKALCKEFSIEDKTCEVLHEAMKTREDYDDDLQALHMIMAHATGKGKKPLEVILTQIRAIKSGKFPGKELLDKDLWAFFEKYNLDDRVLHKLIDTLNARRDKKKDILDALDKRLGSAEQPAGLGLLVRLLEGLDETGRLPSPPRRLGGSGAPHDGRGERERDRGDRDRDDRRDRRGYEERRRSRSRDRR
uniref:Uncharacterized protein n=1 Tax=Pfiesteria piscicida TaxID=71001 RepID=A3E3Q8_PFIPI|nr:unknown [Pfiesteria piscicida]